MLSDKLQNRIDEAKTVILQAYKKSTEPLICNFSGGKDSAALLSLVLEVTESVEAFFMYSGLDLPHSVEHVQKEIKNYDIPLHISDPVKHYQGDFAYWVKKFGYFPATSYTWCSSRLKLRPARAYLRSRFGFASLYKLNGVRRFESSRRKKIYPTTRGYIIPDDEHSGSFVVMPLLNWRDSDVEQYLALKGITINQNYKTCGVSGCKYCPFYQPLLYQKINKTFPGIYDDIISIEKEIKLPSVVGNIFLEDLLAQRKEHSLDKYLNLTNPFKAEKKRLTEFKEVI